MDLSEESVVYLYYFEEDNYFVDCDGHTIYDIFSLITPSDLLLFRRDNAINVFPLRGTPWHSRRYVEITPWSAEEVCLL